MNRTDMNTRAFAGMATEWILDIIQEVGPEMFEHIMSEYRESVEEECRRESSETIVDLVTRLMISDSTIDGLIEANRDASSQIERIKDRYFKLEAANKKLKDANEDLWNRIEILEAENQMLAKRERARLEKEEEVADCCKAGHCGTDKCKGDCGNHKKSKDIKKKDAPASSEKMLSEEECLNELKRFFEAIL